MNYKTLTKEEIDKIMNDSKLFDSLTDDEAFDLMQRYNELNDAPIENSFDPFKEDEYIERYNKNNYTKII